MNRMKRYISTTTLLLCLLLPWEMLFADFTLRLQPYKNVRIEIGNKKVTGKIISRDKTMALIKIPGSGRVQITGRAYKPVVFQARENAAYTVVLGRPDSRVSFSGYYATGIQPKSVTFIDNRRVCAPLLHDSGITIIDVETGKTVRIAPPEKYARKKGFVEADIVGHYLVVSQMTTTMIHLFDKDSLKYIRSIKMKGCWSKVICHDAERKRLYVANWVSRDIAIVSTETWKQIGRFRVPGTPRGLLLSQDRNYLYVCLFTGVKGTGSKGSLMKYRLSDNRLVKKTGTGGAKRHIVMAHNRLYVSDMGRRHIEVYSADNEKLIQYVPVYHKPNTIALSPDNRYLFVSSRGPNGPDGYLKKGLHFGRLTIIDAVSLKVLEVIEGGNQPTGLDVSPDGKWVVFSDFLDNVVRVYRIK